MLGQLLPFSTSWMSLQAFRVYIQIAIVNTKAKTARDQAVQLARRGINLGTMMSWTESKQASMCLAWIPSRP